MTEAKESRERVRSHTVDRVRWERHWLAGFHLISGTSSAVGCWADTPRGQHSISYKTIGGRERTMTGRQEWMEVTGERGKARLGAETRDIRAAKRASKLRKELCKGQHKSLKEWAHEMGGQRHRRQISGTFPPLNVCLRWIVNDPECLNYPFPVTIHFKNGLRCWKKSPQLKNGAEYILKHRLWGVDLSVNINAVLYKFNTIPKWSSANSINPATCCHATSDIWAASKKFKELLVINVFLSKHWHYLCEVESRNEALLSQLYRGSVRENDRSRWYWEGDQKLSTLIQMSCQ